MCDIRRRGHSTRSVVHMTPEELATPVQLCRARDLVDRENTDMVCIAQA
jgi:hypothetical protein